MPTTTPFNNLITFSRGSNATVTGSNGLIQWAPNNLLTFSEQFDNAAAWPKTNATVTANAAIAPDGSSTADLMYPTTTGTNRRILRSTTLTVGTAYAQSVYVKAAGKQWVYLNGIDASGPDNNCWFDLQNGVVGTKGGSVLSAGISAVGGGWYRIFTVALAGANNYFYLMGVDGDNTITSTTNGTDGIFVWGAQLELGSTATTYNSTTVKNLLGFSEAFDNAAWTKSNASIVTGAQANPVNGLFTAQKLMEDTVAAVPHGFASANVTTIVGTPMTSAFYAKAAGRSWIVANAFNAANKRCWFDLANGTAGTTAAGCTTSITSVGNGWYRCAIIQTAAATTMSLGLYASTADGVLSYTGDGNSGVYIYGALLSDSASLDPYVPTPGAAPSSTAFYGPRFDFDPVTLQPRGLLVEEQRTNLLTYSDQFDNAAWAKVRSSITANSTVAPDGTTSADTLVEDTTASATHQMNRVFTGTAVSHTFSVYVKAAGRSQIRMNLYDGATFPNQTYFDLTTATVISGTGGTITAVGNGWYRCTIAATLAASANCQAQLALASGGTDIFTGNGTSGVFIYGAQLEAGAFATSYIPTVASTVTRSADATLISGQNFAQWYRQDEGAFIAEFNVLDQGGVTFTVSDGTGNNRFTGYPAGSVQLEIATGGVLQAALDGGTITPNTNVKVASAYAANNAALSLNGGSAVSDASVTLPTVNQSRIGANVGGGNLLNGWFRSFRFIPARAADFQLQALTT